jgi:hypothetical protein
MKNINDYSPIYHSTGKSPCNGIAFLYETDKIKPFSLMESKYAINPDLSDISAHSYIICYSCNSHVCPPDDLRR